LTNIDHGVGQKLEREMPGLNPFEPKEQPFEFVLPGEGSLHGQAKLVNSFIKQPFSPSLGFLAIPLVFRNIWNHAPVE